ncbi:hypothetical protein [Phormidium sp. CCY1219]|uniref:hypothetical protein n=1 Tax=Phormidium sp. CCY1219 TaxID=2886104 RepID=UPI002D1F990E|nr:hypothetical protein [Phormidium sp. CCY1219]MEB3827643.1 HipA domain-containing protein [Phormidium sp. CCY1219]
MSNSFPVIEVPADATQAPEQLGTKFKFWFEDPEWGTCLYKQSRPNTGEDWAEKIAAQLCEIIGLPYARIELATWRGNRGTVSPSFLPKDGMLILGNEILAGMMTGYPQFQYAQVSQHTIDVVLRAISLTMVNIPPDWIPPAGIDKAVETFVGYLLLDAWIGNSDRHHENWGFISQPRDPSIKYLAPTYDHASSLGRELLDLKRQDRLTKRSVSAYVEKCRSALYAHPGDRKAMKTFEAFREAAQTYPNAALVWLDRLSMVSSRDTLMWFHRIPQNRISSIGIEFAQQILEINQRRLLALKEDLC